MFDDDDIVRFGKRGLIIFALGSLAVVIPYIINLLF